jgi:hypothetical protein
MTGPNVFQSHLRNGERGLWHAQSSPAVRQAAHRRSQRKSLLWISVSIAMSGLLAWFAYEDGRAWLAQPNLYSAFDILKLVVFAALGFGLGVLSVRLYFRFHRLHRITSTWQFHYVLTDQRLFCVDEAGDLMEEIEGHEIVGVELEEEPRNPAVLVERRVWEEEEDKYLILSNLEQPLVAKAKIEETFLEPNQ